jgi:hypothetical protein
VLDYCYPPPPPSSRTTASHFVIHRLGLELTPAQLQDNGFPLPDPQVRLFPSPDFKGLVFPDEEVIFFSVCALIINFFKCLLQNLPYSTYTVRFWHGCNWKKEVNNRLKFRHRNLKG